MSKLVNESLELGKHGCPNCHGRMKQSQAICVNCGYNRESGKMLRTVEQKALVIKEKKSGGAGAGRFAAGAMKYVWNPWTVVGIPGATLAATFFMANDDPKAYGGYFIGAVVVWWALTWIFIIIDAFEEGITDVILCIVFPFYTLYYIFVKSENGLLKILYAVNLVAGLAAQFAIGPAMGDG